MRKNKIHPIVAEWIVKAQNDEKSIEAIIKEKASFDVACFLSQQMAEKSLKALIIHYTKRAPKIHNLLDLENIIIKHNKDIVNYENEIDILNRYYIKTRYPGDLFSNNSWQDAEKALISAQKITNFVIDIIS